MEAKLLLACKVLILSLKYIEAYYIHSRSTRKPPIKEADACRRFRLYGDGGISYYDNLTIPVGAVYSAKYSGNESNTNFDQDCPPREVLVLEKLPILTMALLI